MSFESLKYMYSLGYYTNEKFKVFVRAQWINAEQYKQITGEEYVA
ncbi:XkdX family protein [Staphylococcus chromogenes]